MYYQTEKEQIMKTKDFIKYFLCCGSLIYTVGSVFILLISLGASESASATILAPKPFLFFFGFAYLIALGNTLYRINTFAKPLRRLLHALCYVIGFFVFVLLCGVDFAFSAIFTAVFAVIYGIVTVTAAVIRNQISKKQTHKAATSTTTSEKNPKRSTKSKKSAKETYQSRFS